MKTKMTKNTYGIGEREIKFRGWSKERGRMAHFSVLGGCNEETISKDFGGDRNTPIMQYTGLKDKNRKEIYEGDVLRWWMYLDNGDVIVNDAWKGVVLYGTHLDEENDTTARVAGRKGQENTGWFAQTVTRPDGYYSLFESKESKRYEIIGNIFENPELIV